MQKIKFVYVGLLLLIVFIFYFGFILLIDKIKLSDPGRIKSEIGLSLVDGRNYEWLIQSDRDITDWVEANMRLEGGPKLKSGGWGDITAFGQVSSLAQGEAAQLQLDGVWKSVRQVENGKLETAYLFLAKGGKVGELSTFRP